MIKISSNNLDCSSLTIYIKAIVYLYGISVRFDWLWECGTLGIELVSRIPQMANSWADPERLRSLPLRLLPPPLPPPPPAVTAWCCNVLVVGVGAEIEVEVEETFFFACPPKKNLYIIIRIVYNNLRQVFSDKAVGNVPFFLRRLHTRG